MHHCIAHYQKKPDAQQEEIDSNSEPKKPKSDLGYKPCLVGQNVAALPLAPPPLPEVLTLVSSTKNFNLLQQFGESSFNGLAAGE